MSSGDVASGEWVFGLYMSGRYLQELAVALRLLGVESWYARPGIGGVLAPRLYVRRPPRGWSEDPISATCEFAACESGGGDSEWWFIRMTRDGAVERVCRPVDMAKAARLVAERSRSESWL